jgi:Flp pilus assembly protein protease CpaA
VLSTVLGGGIATALLASILPLVPVMPQPPRLQPRSIIAASLGTMSWLLLVAGRGRGLMLDEFSLKALQTVTIAIVMVLSVTYDLPHKIIPNRLVLSVTAIYLAVLAFVFPKALLDAVLGGLLAAAAMFGLLLVSRGGFGAGDAKLIAVVGVVLGARAAMITCALAFVISGLPALAYIILGKRGHKFAFGPYIAAAGLLVSLSYV